MTVARTKQHQEEEYVGIRPVGREIREQKIMQSTKTTLNTKPYGQKPNAAH